MIHGLDEHKISHGTLHRQAYISTWQFRTSHLLNQILLNHVSIVIIDVDSINRHRNNLLKNR